MNSSLRLRLVAIILIPLLVISGVVMTWAIFDARQRANERFDRSLLSAALAVSRDVALSDGDALSPETNALLQDTSGGRVFYHVYAPDGVFVTGYATPPAPQSPSTAEFGSQTYFDGSHRGAEVRALRYVDAMQIDGLSGEFTFTVWQGTNLRTAIVRDLSLRTIQVITSLVFAVALVVWFGVRIGLRPLMSLERAIARRSPDDLTAIQRQVPVEAKGIVATLNRLFGQVAETLEAKDTFISNAAHQLRNPIAGVVAMSEALASARTIEDMKERSQELASASKRAGDLANKLLAYERASAQTGQKNWEWFDACAVLDDIISELHMRARGQRVSLTNTSTNAPVFLFGDNVMIREATKNLVENALIHGGETLSEISLEIRQEASRVSVLITDNGQGIPADQIERARERFGQARPSQGTGLGLAIADAVMTSHLGTMTIDPSDTGLAVTLNFPNNGYVGAFSEPTGDTKAADAARTNWRH